MGRPSKVLPPPPSWKVSGSLPDLLHADDLAALPQTLKRCYCPDTDFAATAASLNRAFQDYALWAAGQHARASPGEICRWFGQVSGQATGIMYALGHLRTDPSGGGFEDVLLHLMSTRPHLGSKTSGPERERDAKHKPETLARCAAPDLYAAAERDRSDDPAWEILSLVLGPRLQGMLGFLQLLFARGAEWNAQFVKRGGSEEILARKVLFAELVGIYWDLFGVLTTAAPQTTTRAERAAGELRQSIPKGAGLAWFSALVALVGERSAVLSEEEPSDLDRTNLLSSLARLALDAAKGPAKDGLGGWIEEAKAGQRKLLSLAAETDDPDFVPTPLKDLFR